MPTDRRLALLGASGQGKTVLLQILAGVEPPTQGQAISPVRLSPIIRLGRMFHRHLDNLENVRFFARMLNLGAEQLASAVNAVAGSDAFDPSPRRGDRDRRKYAEMALLSLLPFDCYLIDEIGQVFEEARERLFASAAQRRAGVIFATSRPSLARRYADCAIVIRDGIVHPFSQIEEAIAFHEQR